MPKIENVDKVRMLRLKPQDVPHAQMFGLALENARQLGPNLTHEQRFKLEQNNRRFAYMVEIPNNVIRPYKPRGPVSSTTGLITKALGFLGL